jgi:Circularly permutated YpsA SLOG family
MIGLANNNTARDLETMIKKIISGGQTGADRAALDTAAKLNIPHGGWCPRGRLAEDGIIDDAYKLTETPSADSAQRTEWNVRDSDATVILSISAKLSGGSAKTEIFARQYQKPSLHLSRERDGEREAELLSHFLADNKIQILNVAGPRRSQEPEVAEFVSEVLEAVLLR